MGPSLSSLCCLLRVPQPGTLPSTLLLWLKHGICQHRLHPKPRVIKGTSHSHWEERSVSSWEISFAFSSAQETLETLEERINLQTLFPRGMAPHLGGARVTSQDPSSYECVQTASCSLYLRAKSEPWSPRFQCPSPVTCCAEMCPAVKGFAQ